MKKITKILSLLMAAMLMLSVLSACGSNDSKKLIGTWETKVNADEDINASLDGMEEYFKFDGFDILMRFTFNDDGTYSAKMDEDAVLDSFASMRQVFIDGAAAYMQDLILEEGLPMTLDEVLALSGTTLDEMVDQIMESMAELLIANMKDAELAGNWEAKGGRLYTSEALDEEIDKSEYEIYELDGDKLTIYGSDGDPLVLTKVE